jgi:hypothetical protein
MSMSVDKTRICNVVRDGNVVALVFNMRNEEEATQIHAQIIEAIKTGGTITLSEMAEFPTGTMQ